MRTLRTTLTAAAATALLLATGGCGGDSEEAAATTPSATPSSPSPATPSTGDSSADGQRDGDAAHGGASGEAAAFLERLEAGMGKRGSAHVAVRMRGPASMTAEGDTRYGPDGSEMRMRMRMARMATGTIQMVVVDGTAYMSMPGVTKPGTFFEVDPSNPALAGLGDGLAPTDSLAAFEAGLESVDEIGPDRLGTVPATRYRLHVDAAAALDAAGQATVPGMPDELVYDVWLDGDDHMRRLTYELAGTTLTVDMTRWGQDVDIEAPAPADVVDPPPGL